MADVTRLLQAARNGDTSALEELLPFIYADLRRLAGSILRGERPGHTLQPTALVHEVYLRMFQGSAIPAQDRAQFFSLAARVMRQVLVDYARRRNALKRGSGEVAEELHDNIGSTEHSIENILASYEALDCLAVLDERQAKIVELHHLAGLTVEELATEFGVSTRTIKRELHTGRLFLQQKLGNARALAAGVP
jgi:RNA polymerase sigma factor (TIGR02999 family)